MIENVLQKRFWMNKNPGKTSVYAEFGHLYLRQILRQMTELLCDIITGYAE